MATGTTTSTQIPAPIQLFYDRILLRRALPRLVHNMFGQQRPVDMNNGEQPKFRRYASLPQATSPLVEGVTPESQQLSKTDITGQLVQYGAYVTLTDYVQMTTQDRILTETAEILGENAGETLDAIYRDSLVGGTNVQYAGTATARTAVTTFITTADMDKIIRTLTTSNAKFWNEKPIVGMDRHNTTPISPAFYAIVHPKTTYTLKGLTGFIQTHQYPNPSSSMDGEIGAYNQLRFVESTQAKSWADGAGGAATAAYFSGTGTATSVDVFATLVFGRDAYGITPLGGKALENIVKPLGAGEDALNQRSTSGWKATTDLVILNDNFMLRYEHAVSL
jgi:N4-gp56 family major capsid protein